VFFVKTIAITGASGYVGGKLISALLSDGSFRVKVLSRIGTLDYNSTILDGVENMKGDLLSPTSLQDYLKPGCIVVNLVISGAPAKVQILRQCRIWFRHAGGLAFADWFMLVPRQWRVGQIQTW
jgi:putative NADH-flavin reductase